MKRNNLFTYALLSSAILSTAYAATPEEFYEYSILRDCNYSSQSFQQCTNELIKAGMARGVNVRAEASVAEAAKLSAFDDGQFTVGEKATEYKFIEIAVRPFIDHSYIENQHHYIYFTPDMQTMDYISAIYRHGAYGQGLGFGEVKNSNHEIVRIDRVNGVLKELNEQVYLFVERGQPVPMDMDGYQLYKFQSTKRTSYVTGNYTITPGDSGTGGQWSPGFCTGDPCSNEEGVRSGKSSEPPQLNLDGTFKPESDMQFGYSVMLLVRHNDDGTVTYASVNRDKSTGMLMAGYENGQDFVTLFQPDTNNKAPSADSVTDSTGWMFHKEGFSPDLSQGPEHLTFATTSVNGQPRFVCRFQTVRDNQLLTLFGVVEEIQQNKMVCSGGSEISMVSRQNGREALRSEVNTFEWLSLANAAHNNQAVLARVDKQLCSVELAPFYGVGYLNEKGSCVQSSEVYWSNGRPWQFSKGWKTFQFF